MTDSDFGIYILQQYASVAKVSPPELVRNFKARYSDAGVAYIGKLAKPVPLEVIKKKFSEFIQNAPIPKLGYPDKGDLTGILLEAGATLPSASQAVVAGLEESGKQIGAFSILGLKAAVIILVVAGVAYLAFQAKGVRAVLAKAK